MESKLNKFTVRPDLSILGLGSEVDVASASLVPLDFVQVQGLLPIQIVADGNCLARCGSMLAYGTESHHSEIRLRIAIEMIQYRHLYLDDNYLARGVEVHGRNNSSQRYAQFSAEFITNDVLTENKISEIYSEEIRTVLKMGTSMGVWAMFALASVLHMPIFAVYPHLGSKAAREDLHRLILPRQETAVTKRPVYIMWTTTRTDMNEEHWVANHFVVLLPVLQRDHAER